jgi:predicted enzyme related to lactoylglutathione lyase
VLLSLRKGSSRYKHATHRIRAAKCRRAASWSAVAFLVGALFLELLASQCSAASPFWEKLFGRSNSQYYPVGTQYVPVTSYYPLTTYVPVTVYYPVPGTTAISQAAATGGAALMAPSSSPGLSTAAGVAGVGSVVPAGGAVSVGQYPAAGAAQVTWAPDGGTLAGGAWGAAMPATAMAGTATVPGPVVGPTVVVPQTSYRTVWYRIPVTSFRPVTTVDPATGALVTTMSPCVTYTWQARRVPTGNSGGGVFSRLFGHNRQATAPAPASLPACVPTLPATGTPVTGTVVPSAPGSGAPPGYLVPPSGPWPGASSPGTSSVPSYGPTQPGTGGREPADRPPSLEPGRYVPPSSSGVGTGSGGTTSLRAPNWGAADIGLSNAVRSPLSEASRAFSQELHTHEAQADSAAMATLPADASRAPTSPSQAPDGRAGVGERAGAVGPDPDLQFRLRPVPDPRARQQEQPSPNAPRLINPRDRTALHDSRPESSAEGGVQWATFKAETDNDASGATTPPGSTPDAILTGVVKGKVQVRERSDAGTVIKQPSPLQEAGTASTAIDGGWRSVRSSRP